MKLETVVSAVLKDGQLNVAHHSFSLHKAWNTTKRWRTLLINLVCKLYRFAIEDFDTLIILCLHRKQCSSVSVGVGFTHTSIVYTKQAMLCLLIIAGDDSIFPIVSKNGFNKTCVLTIGGPPHGKEPFSLLDCCFGDLHADDRKYQGQTLIQQNLVNV